MTKQTPSERLLKKSPDVMDVSRPLSRESAIILDEHHARIAANESQLARAMPFLETMAKRCLGGGNPLIDVEVRSTSLAFLNTKPTSPPAEAASEWPSDVIKVWQSIKSGDLFTLYDGGRLVLTVAETGRDMLSGVSARELDAMTSKYEVVFTRPPNPPAGQGDKGDGGPVCMGCLGTGFMEGVGPCKACRGSGNDKPSVAPPSPSASAKATVEEEARRWAEKCVGWDDQYVCLTLRRTPGDIGAMVLRGKLSPSYSGQFCEFLLAFHRQQSVGVVEEKDKRIAELERLLGPFMDKAREKIVEQGNEKRELLARSECAEGEVEGLKVELATTHKQRADENFAPRTERDEERKRAADLRNDSARLTALVAAQKKVIEAWDVVGKDIFDTYAYDRLAAAKAELLRVGGGV